jgi:hypothetical protein
MSSISNVEYVFSQWCRVCLPIVLKSTYPRILWCTFCCSAVHRFKLTVDVNCFNMLKNYLLLQGHKHSFSLYFNTILNLNNDQLTCFWSSDKISMSFVQLQERRKAYKHRITIIARVFNWVKNSFKPKFWFVHSEHKLTVSSVSSSHLILFLKLYFPF